MRSFRYLPILFLSLFALIPCGAEAAPLKAPTLSASAPADGELEILVNVNSKYRKANPSLIIERADDENSTFLRLGRVKASRSRLSLFVDAPAAGTRQRFRARLRTASGKSSWSNILTVESPATNNGGEPDDDIKLDDPIGGCSAEVRAKVLELTNVTRALAGVGPLRAHTQLDRSAQAHSESMAQIGILSHAGWIDFIFDAGFDGNWIGENIAQGYKTPDAVMTGWNSSPGHYANIVNPSFSMLGVGCMTDSRGNLFWAQNFGGY